MPTLHDYQREAVEFLKERRAAALFLDMGLGKTAVALTALGPEHLPVLVIAPKRVAENVWTDEAALWRPDLTVAVAAGGPARRRAALASGADIVALGRDNLKDLTVEDAERFRTVILDELSSFKSPSSVRFKNLRRFLRWSPLRPVVWGLTGTPTPNGLIDLWSQMFLLDEGRRLGTGVTRFRYEFFVPGRQLRSGVVTEWNLRQWADRDIHRRLEGLCLSMSTEGRVALPPVTVNRVPVPLPGPARKAYDELKQDLVTHLETLGEIHSAANAAVLTGKLSQITAGFMYHDDADLRGGTWSPLHTAKIDALREIVEASLGSPVLVFYQFKAELAALREAFPEARGVDQNSIAAWNRGEVGMMLAHPASAGHGLNLQHGGHTIVWTTPTWSMELNEQANKRLARQGQKHPVVIHYLTCPQTVDLAILARVQDKKSVQAALMEHLEIA